MPIMNTLKMITPSGSNLCFPTGYLNFVLSSLCPAHCVVPKMINDESKSRTDSTREANKETLSDSRTAAPFVPRRSTFISKLTII